MNLMTETERGISIILESFSNRLLQIKEDGDLTIFQQNRMVTTLMYMTINELIILIEKKQ